MNISVLQRLLVVLGGVVLFGCASPAARYYTLDALVPASATQRNLSILVGPVGVPARVDRRQIVLGVGSVSIEESDMWAGPLREEIGRAVALNLSHRLGASQVVAWPQNMLIDPDFRVFVDLARFESQPGTRALAEVSWTVRDRNDKTLASGRQTYEEALSDKAIRSLIAAHNRILAAVSEEIAQAISRGN